MAAGVLTLFASLFYFQLVNNGSYAATLNFKNKCGFTVSPGILPVTGARPPTPTTTGFSPDSDEPKAVLVPETWSGTVWGRTFCSSNTGKFHCSSGDCGGSSTAAECNGWGPSPPATVADFMLNHTVGGMDSFALRLVEAFNLPVSVEPQGVLNCGTAVCFDPACPAAKFTCQASDFYTITFCPKKYGNKFNIAHRVLVWSGSILAALVSFFVAYKFGPGLKNLVLKFNCQCCSINLAMTFGRNGA